MNTTKSASITCFEIIISISIFFLIGCNSDQKQNSIFIDKKEHVKVDTSYSSFIRANYKIYSIPLPDSPTFAKEKVPISNIDVYERLDRELIVNTFWHSNSFLLHKRAARWFPIIEPILKENNIPDDFKYLAVIESGLENVTSPSGAKGFWQFMPKTGESYDLEINDFVDERYNLEKATKAACEYLNSAYKQFGNWTLAAASYNMGKTGLENQLEKQRSTNYYDLLLNVETGRYVYRIIAAKYILSNPKDYGFNIRKEDLYMPYKTKNILIDSTINNLTSFSEKLNSNYKTIKLLNPWLRSNKLPNSNGKIYTIKVPANNSNLEPINTSY